MRRSTVILGSAAVAVAVGGFVATRPSEEERRQEIRASMSVRVLTESEMEEAKDLVPESDEAYRRQRALRALTNREVVP